MKFLRKLFKKKSVVVPKKFISESEIKAITYIELRVNHFDHLRGYNPDVNYWVAFVAAICYAESNYNLLERYVETGLGKDAITGEQNTSEGLMQLSYQDSKYHGAEFNWLKDMDKLPYDETKTIFDPKLNILAGLIILNKQVGKFGCPIFNSGNYWAVLKPNNDRHEIFFKKFKELYR
jgi:hypothetical protein